MKSESRDSERIQMRSGSVTKAVTLCFPREKGGDLMIEPGDLVVLTVIDGRKQKHIITNEEPL